MHMVQYVLQAGEQQIQAAEALVVQQLKSILKWLILSLHFMLSLHISLNTFNQSCKGFDLRLNMLFSN